MWPKFTDIYGSILHSEPESHVLQHTHKSRSFFFFFKKKNLMNLFYGWVDSTVSRLQSHYDKIIYFLPVSPQYFLVPIWPTSERGKAEVTLEPPGGWFWTRHPGLGIQHSNHYAIANFCNYFFQTKHSKIILRVSVKRISQLFLLFLLSTLNNYHNLTVFPVVMKWG